MRKWIVWLIVLGFVGALTGVVLNEAGAANGGTQELCPVMGGKIDHKVHVDHQGERIYFCCEGCKGDFMKDPDKYLEKMRNQGIKLDKSPG